MEKHHSFGMALTTPDKVTVDLQGCLPENAVYMRCFKENHGKLHINVKLINCRIRK